MLVVECTHLKQLGSIIIRLVRTCPGNFEGIIDIQSDGEENRDRISFQSLSTLAILSICNLSRKKDTIFRKVNVKENVFKLFQLLQNYSYITYL